MESPTENTSSSTDNTPSTITKEKATDIRKRWSQRRIPGDYHTTTIEVPVWDAPFLQAFYRVRVGKRLELIEKHIEFSDRFNKGEREADLFPEMLKYFDAQ